MPRPTPASRPRSGDLATLDGASADETLRAALAEFDWVWGASGPDERARVLALVLEEVVVDARTGEAELRFRGRSR